MKSLKFLTLIVFSTLLFVSKVDAFSYDVCKWNPLGTYGAFQPPKKAPKTDPSCFGGVPSPRPLCTSPTTIWCLDGGFDYFSYSCTCQTFQTGSITVSSNISSGSWTITGLNTISGSGLSQTSPTEKAGTYTITFNAVTGYTTPPSQTLSLASGGAITFNGTYVALPPTVQIWFSLLNTLKSIII